MGREALLSVPCQVASFKAMRRHFVAVALVLTVLAPLRAAEAIQQKLQTRVPNYNLSEPTFVDALTKLEPPKPPPVPHGTTRSMLRATPAAGDQPSSFIFSGSQRTTVLRS